MKRLPFSLLLSFLAFTSIGCTEYWWTRGQPPAVGTLVQRSQLRLAEARDSHADHREAVAQISNSLEQSLVAVHELLGTQGSGRASSDEITERLQTAVDSFIALEGKVSIGSRAALGELSGQMRNFVNAAESGQGLAYPAFGLFTARTLFFLANELSVPAPNFG